MSIILVCESVRAANGGAPWAPQRGAFGDENVGRAPDGAGFQLGGLRAQRAGSGDQASGTATRAAAADRQACAMGVCMGGLLW